jgi:hypothetical protein
MRKRLWPVTGCVVLALTLAGTSNEGLAQPQPKPYRISGHVEGISPWLSLSVGTSEGEISFGEQPVPLAPDGSFVTMPISPGTFVLHLTEPSSKEPNSRGVQIVNVTTADVSGVVLRPQEPYALTGSFRMESDNPAAVWPPHIVVNAELVASGARYLGSEVGEGAAGGKFVLRNLYGPRVLRCGYTLAPGSRWWPANVLLNGQDITDVPTDFSTVKNAKLEVVFTQHPARLAGTVANSTGGPVSEAWVVVFPAERELWHRWSARATAMRTDWKGNFDLARMPGRYLVTAVTPEMWLTRERLLARLERLSRDAVEIQLAARERKTVALRTGAQ